MTFKELEALMVKHGAVIRAITENDNALYALADMVLRIT